MSSIALVVPAYEEGGGVRTVTDFILDGLRDTAYVPTLYSLASSARSPVSRRILRPSTWTGYPRMDRWETPGGREITRVGSDLAEIEYLRFRPRDFFTRELNRHDLVQVVCGIPAWAWVCRDCRPPVLLQVATLTPVERASKKEGYRGLAGLWKRLMTGMVTGLDSRGLGVSDAILVENAWMQEWLEERGYGGKTHFAPPGVDTGVFHPPEEGEDNPLQRPYILSVGRFSDPRKDVETLFRAYALLMSRTEGPVPGLVLAGRSMPGEAVRKLARELGIWDRISLMQNLTRGELAELYRHADFFVLSSREEGLGMVIMEAMASGTAVLSTDSGGPRTLITPGESGLLTPVGDPGALAEGMRELIEDPARRKRMAGKGLQTVRERFTLRQAIDTYKTLYTRMLQ
ncbi:MAG: glycosyltransferase [Balneolaceae bacterium]|nr:glycosyltransferase [Balneolaceae bacterium]